MLENLGERLPHEAIVVNNQDAASSEWCPGLSVVGRSRQRAAQEEPPSLYDRSGTSESAAATVALFKSAQRNATLADTVPTLLG